MQPFTVVFAWAVEMPCVPVWFMPVMLCPLHNIVTLVAETVKHVPLLAKSCVTLQM